MNTKLGLLWVSFIVILFIAPRTVPAAAFTSIDHLGEWCEDIGVARSGSTVVVETGKAYDVSGYGSEYGFHCREDQGRFVYREIAGDFDVHVQVAEIISAKDALHKHGGHPVPAGALLMARADVTVGSPFVGMYVMDNNDETYPYSHYLAVRRVKNGSLFEGHGPAFDNGYINPRTNPAYFKREFPNVWLRLRREGGEFSGWTSKNGIDWTPTSQASFKLKMPHKLLVGMAVSPAAEPAETVMSTVRFRNLSGFPEARPKGLEVRREIVYYDVDGSSAREMLASMRRLGPQNSGRSFFGYHEWDLRWSTQYEFSGGICRMEDVRIELVSTTTLPRWNRPSEVFGNLGDQWDDFISALKEHEHGHEVIVEAGARELLKALQELRVERCDLMDARTNELANMILTRVQGEGVSYDEQTEDGRTQGAVWPPARGRR